ncbi:hypothetical protein D3H65_12025 [Paraflavitalea soli]|uniref:DUF5074 domain-containing protein n=2 Tax=Paraflavitalea soli TaxID=2315862 RepID=A0A3B7MMX8_9BACT|nr:hypothetical protein D3H65_12025 [Paraflavitalea soli]
MTTMKTIYILAAGLLLLLAAACNKDDSTGTTGPIATLKVSGLKDTFTVFTHQDFLKINPVVENEQNFDFYWTLASTDFIPGQGAVKFDTLARSKDLNYEVLQSPGVYYLVFNAKEKSTGIVRQVVKVANITTLTMNGWYLLKENGGKTDMDFIHSTGRIDNWIANFNNGKSLDGNAVKMSFVPSFRTTPTSTAYFPTIMVLSANDAAIYRIDNGAMVMNFDNMFFTKPATRKPQAVIQPVANTQLYVINDNKAYFLSKGTLFGNMPVNINNQVYDNISPITAVGAAGICWNARAKNIFCLDGSNLTELGNNGAQLRNMKADLKWMNGYAGSRSAALLLFRNPQDSGYLFKLNVMTGQLLYNSTGLITAVDTLKPEHSLMSASVIGGNYDYDVIYYAVGDKIYMTDFGSLQETLLFTLPAGETVTAIQHIKFPESLGNPPPASTLSRIAIATYKDGRYKIYLHPINGTGTISGLPQANFEGEGRVSSMMYMEKGAGTRIF